MVDARLKRGAIHGGGSVTVNLSGGPVIVRDNDFSDHPGEVHPATALETIRNNMRQSRGYSCELEGMLVSLVARLRPSDVPAIGGLSEVTPAGLLADMDAIRDETHATIERCLGLAAQLLKLI